MALNKDRTIETNRGGIACSVCIAIAGMTPEDRGTHSGFLTHVRLGEPIDPECLRAEIYDLHMSVLVLTVNLRAATERLEMILRTL